MLGIQAAVAGSARRLAAILDVELGRDLGWRFRRLLGDLAHSLAGAPGALAAVLRFLNGRLRTGDPALQVLRSCLKIPST